ncbi:MAG: NADH-quinone oxidoreductase subunit J [Chromatiales bacterium]|nr:MAG: NADH-quinone oxidoreductase subunit J [Chromatiales bacterium]
MAGTLFFYTLSAVLIASALGVITARNPVHAVLFLVLSFVTSSVLWLLLEAEFLAVVLVLVYVGAVMVLFLFVVMMLDVNVAQLREGFTRYAWLGAVVAAVLAAELLAIVWWKPDGLPMAATTTPRPADYSNTEMLGTALYTEHLFAFELAAFLLLLAIVAAIVLTMRRRPGLKAQDVSRQVAVRREDRVRLVQMKAEHDT